MEERLKDLITDLQTMKEFASAITKGGALEGKHPQWWGDSVTAGKSRSLIMARATGSPRCQSLTHFLKHELQLRVLLLLPHGWRTSPLQGTQHEDTKSITTHPWIGRDTSPPLGT